MKSLNCTIIGDVFIDVIVQVDNDYEQLFQGGTSYCNYAKVALGGSGNVAAGLSVIGGKAAFVGKVGRDLFGRLYIHDMKEKGVVTKIFIDNHSPTGLIIAFVEDATKRSFLVFRGSNDKLSYDEIKKATGLIRRSDYLYLCGYSLVNEPQRSAIFSAIEIAKRFQIKIIFDPGAFNLVKTKKRLFAKILDSCDVFSPNLKEAQALTNKTSIDDIVEELRDRVPLTTLKCGQDGCILISKNDTLRVSGYGVRCVDPTGAGDAFTAGVIYGLSCGFPLMSIGRLANWFAAEVVTEIGPRSFPTKSKIESFLLRL